MDTPRSRFVDQMSEETEAIFKYTPLHIIILSSPPAKAIEMDGLNQAAQSI